MNIKNISKSIIVTVFTTAFVLSSCEKITTGCSDKAKAKKLDCTKAKNWKAEGIIIKKGNSNYKMDSVKVILYGHIQAQCGESCHIYDTVYTDTTGYFKFDNNVAEYVQYTVNFEKEGYRSQEHSGYEENAFNDLKVYMEQGE